jgi:hypothetical protein
MSFPRRRESMFLTIDIRAMKTYYVYIVASKKNGTSWQLIREPSHSTVLEMTKKSAGLARSER